MIEIRHATFPDGTRGTIRLEGPRIVDIVDPEDTTLLSEVTVIEGSGLTVLPGLIDPHVHFRVPGGEHKEDWAHGIAAALRGGVTTVFDMPNTSPPLVTTAHLAEKKHTIGHPPIHYRLWFGSTPTNAREIAEALRDETVCGVKTYLGSSTGDLVVTDDAVLRQIAEVCAQHGAVWAVHCEDEALMRQKRARLGRVATVADHCRIRDTAVEVSAVRHAIQVAADTGCVLYLVHLSAPESVELAYDAKQRGLPVWVEVCPHHVLFSECQLWTGNGGFFKMNPPLRTPSQVLRLRELLVQPDFVDTTATDHAPHTTEEKQASAYDQVPSGVPGVQERFGLLYDLVARGLMSCERFVELTSRAAARIFRLPAKGQIIPGSDADLVLMDPKQSTTFTHAQIESKCSYTVYDGRIVPGRIRYVIAGGVLHAL